MLQWKQMFSVMAAGAVIAVLAGNPAPASAQQAAAPQAAAAAPAAAAPQRPVLRARDLMTAEERQTYRQAIRETRNDPARREQVRTQWRTTLRERAAARGAVLAEPAAAKPGQKEAGAKREAPPRAP